MAQARTRGRSGARGLELRRGAHLGGFTPSRVEAPALVELFDDDRFRLTIPGKGPTTGTFDLKGGGGSKLRLHFDIRSLSQLEREFALEAAEIVASDDSDPPSPTLTFYPNRVDSAGVANLTQKGVAVSLRVTFGFKRDPRGAPGSRGSFLYRGKGTPAE